jgi:hypothetical protein
MAVGWHVAIPISELHGGQFRVFQQVPRTTYPSSVAVKGTGGGRLQEVVILAL